MNSKLFCIECGCEISAGMYCANCKSKITPPHSENQQSDIQIVRYFAQWEVPQNVIGRRISPQDFENLANLKGLTIQKGVAAFIYIDGKEVSEIHGGSYEFISQTEINKYLEQKTYPEFIRKINSGLKAVGALITGKKLRTQIEERAADNLSSIKNIDDVISRLRPNSSVEIYLLSEIPFSIVFNSLRREDGKREFRPFSIRCRNLSINMELTLQFRINDPRSVITHLLSNRSYLSTYALEEQLSSKIRYILEDVLRDCDIDEYGIPPYKRQTIESRLKEISNCLPGIELTAVADISTSNSDFERLRQISDELFLSEKELEAAIRTNNFRNKLAAVENQSKIDELKNGLDLYKAIAEIDKEKTLHEEELDQFYLLVSRQRIIREAQNEEEIRKALQDLEMNKLLSKDDMDALLLQLADKKIERETISEMINMQHLANVEMKRIEIEDILANRRFASEMDNLRRTIDIDKVKKTYLREDEIEEVKHKNDLIKTELEGQSLVDQYEDDRYTRHRDRFRDEETWKTEQEWRKRERRNEEFKSMMGFIAEQHEREETVKHQHDMEKLASEQAYNQNMAEVAAKLETDKLSIQSRMSSDQIMAASGNLSEAAQVELAKSAGAQKVLETEIRHKAEIEQKNAHTEEIFKGYTDKLFDLVNNLAGSQIAMRDERERFNEERYRHQAEMAQEYREEKNRAQERQDNYSRHLMEHEEKLQSASIGTINAISGRVQEPAPQQLKLIKCPNCGQQVPQAKFCNVCSAELSIIGNK